MDLIIEKNVVTELANRIGYTFKNPALIYEAIVHRSYFNEHPTDKGHNERLEFLGDAVLDLIIADTLMQMLPLAFEGQLTQGRAALVNENSLAKIAKNLDLDSAILLGKGEEQNKGREKPSILSDTVEAVVGAIYLDGGLEEARNTILAWFAPMISQVVSGTSIFDAKTELQEYLQGSDLGTPKYRVIGSIGPDHEKTFEVEIVANDETLANGIGRSKKEAEKNAAHNALLILSQKDKDKDK